LFEITTPTIIAHKPIKVKVLVVTPHKIIGFLFYFEIKQTPNNVVGGGGM